ncbi:MAG TPA: DUF2333 family protein [Candidatus Acidoferrum sp.]|nr:DUF2333 family protein [Candidatus Acidoferrum sp.]
MSDNQELPGYQEVKTSRFALPRLKWGRAISAVVALLVVINLALMWWWDKEVPLYDSVAKTSKDAAARGEKVVVGTLTTDALIQVVDHILHKRGGYLSNAILPPGIFMDNMPNWEFGALVQCRDLARALRNGFSRSLTQSMEDKDLAEAEPLLSFTNDRWIVPSSVSQYTEAMRYLTRYRSRLQDGAKDDAQFFARADNLADYLGIVESRLGSLSQRLSASVGQLRINTDLGNDANAVGARQGANQNVVRTPWYLVDDVFYESRGSVFALVIFLHAIENDFGSVLDKKNARVSLQQVIRELEEAQAPLESPIVLNGSSYGFFANHSLVLANYISRANATVIELRTLLQRG